jgi:hypothetical protein
MTWSQPRTTALSIRSGVAGPTLIRSIAAREIAGPLKPVPSPSRSLVQPPPPPPGVPPERLPWMADRLCTVYEGVFCAAQRWLSRSSNGTRLQIPREVVEASGLVQGHERTHTCSWLQRGKKKKSKSCRTQTAHPVKDRLASHGCGCWRRGGLKVVCVAGTALYPDSGSRPGSPGQAD